MIYNILLLLLLIEAVVALNNPPSGLGLCLAIIFLVPNCVKLNFGVGMNSFNLAVLIIIVSLSKNVFSQRCVYPAITKSILLYFSYVIITSLLCALENNTLDEYLQNMVLLFMEYGMLAYFMCWMKMDTREIKRFNKILFLVSVIIIIYGFFNYVIKFNPYREYISLITNLEVDMSNDFMEEQRGFLDGRVSSVFGHPLSLGQWTVLIFAYSIYEFKEQLHPIFYYIFMLSLFIIALLTGSRSSLLPILVTIFIFVINHKPSKVVKSFLCISLLFSLSYSFFPKNFQSYFEATVFFWDDKASSNANINGSSKEGRIEQLELAWGAIDDGPILGKGFNYNVKKRDDLPNGLVGLESIFLSHLVDGGLLGLSMFIMFYFKLYMILRSYCHTRIARSRVDSLCLSYFICICLTGITYSFFCIYLIFYMVTLYRISGINRICMRSKKDYFLSA